jgi:hypothetical protein
MSVYESNWVFFKQVKLLRVRITGLCKFFPSRRAARGQVPVN